MPAGDTDPRSGKSTVDQSWHAIVSREDPDRIREMANEIYYIMSNGRVFYRPEPPGIYDYTPPPDPEPEPEPEPGDACVHHLNYSDGTCNFIYFVIGFP